LSVKALKNPAALLNLWRVITFDAFSTSKLNAALRR
jgi:hypothetical protein